MKILAQRHFCQPDTKALHPILQWKLKIVLRCLRISFLEGQDGCQAFVAGTLECRTEREVSGSCNHGPEHSPWKLTGWEQGVHAAGYRPNFRDSSSTVSSVCQYTKICLHQQVRLISSVHRYLLLQPHPSLTNTTGVKEDLFGNGPLQQCSYYQQKPESLAQEAYSCGRWSRSSAEVASSVLSRKDVLAWLQHLSWKKTESPSKYTDCTNLSPVQLAPGRGRAAEKVNYPTGAHSVPAACLKWGFIRLALFICNEFADIAFFIIFPLL